MSLRSLFLLLLSLACAHAAPPESAATGVFPKPDPEKAFAELKVLQPDGSAFRTPCEDWDGARKHVADEPEWAKWVAARRAVIDAWMVRHHDRAGWEAGWNHEFVSPTDGAFLVWTEDVPGEDTQFVLSRTGERVPVTPKIARAWVGSFRKKHAEMMGEAAQLFRLTGDIRYAEWTASQLDFYANHYSSWGQGAAQRKYAWLGYQSLDDAVLVSRYVEATRLIFSWAEPARRQAWFDRLFKPEVELLDRSFQAIHNIALWQRSTQAQVALLYGDGTLWARAVDGDYGVRAQFKRGVTGDYLWYEQSMGYNSFVVVAVQPLLTFAGLLGEKARLRDEAAIAQNLMLAPIYLRFPDGTLPNPADANGIGRASTGLLAQIYRILPTTPGLVRAQTVRSWDALLDPPAAIAPLPDAGESLPPVVSRSFESTRFALLKQGPWQVFFHYGQVTQSHSQAEALNWSASFDGVDISHDPGTVGYGSPMSPGYYRQGLNHNVPLVGGEGSKPWKPGTLLRFDAAAAIMSAAQPEYRPGATARRTLHIEGDTLIDEAVVTAVATADAPPPKLGLALHLQGKPRLSSAFHEVSADSFAAGRPVAFGYWKDVRAATFRDKAEVEVEFAGGRVLVVTFATSGAFTLYQGLSPDAPPASRAGFYLEKNDDDAEATFVTTFRPAAKID